MFCRVSQNVIINSQIITLYREFLILEYVFHWQGLMKYDSDLQMELLKNQEIDLEVRGIQEKNGCSSSKMWMTQQL